MNPEKPPKSQDFEIVPSEGETVEEDINLKIARYFDLRLILTDKAAYWVGHKPLAVSDDRMEARAALHEINSVRVGRFHRLLAGLLGGYVLFAGCAWLVLIASGKGMTPSMAVLPQILVFTVWGAATAFLGNRRRTLRIALRKGGIGLVWVSPIAFGGGLNQEVDTVLAKVDRWAERHSLNGGRADCR